MTAKRVWIIGASSGIGRAIAVQLAKEGAHLVLSARDAAALEEIAAHSENVQILPMDIADRAALLAASGEISAPLDAIIHAAALYEPSLVSDIEEDFLDNLIAVNLTAVFHLAKLAPKLLRTGGQFVIFGSVAGYIGLPKGQPYSASKAAVTNLAETLRIELAPQIDVRLVSPGFVSTRLTAKNGFAMPAIITPETAAREVILGMAGRKFEIHFPRRFTLAMKLLRALPYRVSLAFTAGIGRKK